MASAAQPSLWECLGRVNDHRSAQGRRFSLQSLLGLAIAAVLCGCQSLYAIAQWIGEVRKKGLLDQFGIDRRRGPCQATLHYVFTDLDVKSLEPALAAWVTGISEQREGRQIAIDGKTARGSASGEYEAVHLLTAYCDDLKGVLGQYVREAGGNEITAAHKLLNAVDVRGAVVSGDAMFCQRTLCEKTVSRGGDYIFPVKDNQPELKNEIETALAPAVSPLRGAHPAA